MILVRLNDAQMARVNRVLMIKSVPLPSLPKGNFETRSPNRKLRLLRSPGGVWSLCLEIFFWRLCGSALMPQPERLQRASYNCKASKRITIKSEQQNLSTTTGLAL